METQTPVIKHSDVERINRALRTVGDGENSPVSIPPQVEQQKMVLPDEFRSRLYDTKATKQQLRELLRDVGHMVGLFTNQTDAEVALYRAMFSAPATTQPPNS